MQIKADAPYNLEKLCLSAAKASKNFEEFAAKCKGLFPTEAHSVLSKAAPAELERLLKRRISPSDLPDARSAQASFAFSTWDFTPETNEAVASLLDFSRSVLCLGCPTIASAIATKKSLPTPVLIDANEHRLKKGQNPIHIDFDISCLSGKEFSGAFSGCVLDPPWYMEDLFWWIWIARNSLEERGLLVFPLFGEMTRPTGSRDRDLVIEWSKRLGFAIEIQVEAASYLVPSFEAHILHRAGLPTSPWKKADLVFARVENAVHDDCVPTRPKVKPPVFHSFYQNVLIEVLIDRFDSTTEHLIKEPEGGYLMTSPSRSELGNSSSNVFTSTGKRAICSRPMELVRKLALNTVNKDLVSLPDNTLQMLFGKNH